MLKITYCLSKFSSVSSKRLSVLADLPLRLLSSLVILLNVAAFNVIDSFWGHVLLIGNIFHALISQMIEGDGSPFPLAAAYLHWSLAHPSWRKHDRSECSFYHPSLGNREFLHTNSAPTFSLELLEAYVFMQGQYTFKMWIMCVKEMQGCLDFVVLKYLSTWLF